MVRPKGELRLGMEQSPEQNPRDCKPAASPLEFPVFLSHDIQGQRAKDGHLVINSAVPFLQLPFTWVACSMIALYDEPI